ncbi:class I SAM-dependent methyltransferase [Paracoccus sp. MC1862]|uniref:class I SAM-dependent methyltransferase n=1 Tax=Paracoccus sp. MC1862 TaxID=2760307 RepID=UPI0016042BCA|nr:class I SAM-dependent methyltransferase [Paracoccus sp. MC1862]MBB1499291.1 class I SAM-dependent methyltransferase [Paracoccus sp. MC1862]QQO46048.1 class I SAM-dependent methyltransferase [Paracoccus sp. MC1862]
MNPNKELWEKGDFSKLAETMRGSADQLVEELGITPGMKALDLACGDGGTALPMARRGAEVLGVDIARNLVAAAQARVAAEGLTNIRIIEGDACDLSALPDNAFDLVLSVFGAMFAPCPQEVARSMVRVARRGGRIVMGNWIPNDPTMPAQILRMMQEYGPPPPEGFIPPTDWGIEAKVIERFGQAGIPHEAIAMQPSIKEFRLDGPPSALLEIFLKYFGPVIRVFEWLGPGPRADELRGRMLALIERENQGEDGKTLIRARYLLVTVKVPQVS